MEMRRYFGRPVEAFSIWTPRLTNLGRTLWLDLLSRPPPGRREWVSSVYPASLSSLPSSPLQALLLVSSSEAPFPRFAFLRVLLFFLAGNFDVVPERETKQKPLLSGAAEGAGTYEAGLEYGHDSESTARSSLTIS